MTPTLINYRYVGTWTMPWWGVLCAAAVVAVLAIALGLMFRR